MPCGMRTASYDSTYGSRQVSAGANRCARLRTQWQVLNQVSGYHKSCHSNVFQCVLARYGPQEGSAARLLEALQEDVGNLRFQVGGVLPPCVQ